MKEYKKQRMLDEVREFVLNDYDFMRAGQLLRDCNWDLEKVKKLLKKANKEKKNES